MSTTTPTDQQQLHKAVCDLIASERLENAQPDLSTTDPDQPG